MMLLKLILAVFLPGQCVSAGRSRLAFLDQYYSDDFGVVRMVHAFWLVLIDKNKLQ